MIRVIRKGGVIDPLDLRVAAEIGQHLLCIFRVTLQTEGERLRALKKQKSVKGRNGGSGIPKEDRPDVGDEGRRPYRIIEGNAMVAGVRAAIFGYLPLALQSNLPDSTIMPPRVVP